MGANMSIESATVLANVLHRASTAHPHTPYHPSLPELSALFTQYQSKRYTRAKTFVGISGNVTRMCSYSSLWGRFVVGYIATLPFMQKMQAKRMGMGFARAPKLEYVPTRTINENAEGWKVEKRAKRGAGRAWIVYVLLTSVVGVAVSYAAILSKGRLL
jgi:FAD dependent monooxygenase